MQEAKLASDRNLLLWSSIDPDAGLDFDMRAVTIMAGYCLKLKKNIFDAQ